ncbi:hypothetical protein BBK14_11315 [Parafrankia soli]|uniref:Uncharacterized protein n=2 Tax=Parafrankia soli TaxID=2599596 RepID=A0A1S1R5I5_9ACTN|nr:hypothetical protein BBK14_11315 [Parafrankia soli]
MVEVTAEVPAGLDEAATIAMFDALDDLGIGGIGSSCPAAEFEARLDQDERLRDFARWVVSTDDLPGVERVGITRHQIAQRARQALGQESHDD